MALQILLDMDGVIVDLPCPVPCSESELIDFYQGKLKRTNAELWANTDADWWANLPWTKDGKEIVAVCEQVVGAENVIICTKPADWSGSAEGKIRWLEREMPSYRRRFILTPQKHWCANSRSLLIDDSDDNIRQYQAAGGPGLICPRPWNECADAANNGKTVHFIQTFLQAK